MNDRPAALRNNGVQQRCGMATHKPSTVVIKAVEMPPAMVLGSPVPNRVMAWKVRIMPITVPSRPTKGATTDIT